MQIFGVDFTSRPRAGARGKAIRIAQARLGDAGLALRQIDACTDFSAFEGWLATPGPWVGGFDFPFGLPRAFVDAHCPGSDWAAMVRWAQALGREGFCAVTFAAFSAARGVPLAKHRAVDLACRSHSPLKTMDPVRRIAINPPVGLMFFEGAPRLLAAGLHLPGLHASGDARVGLEVYPGALAIALGERYYKNDTPANGSARQQARARLVAATRAGVTLASGMSLPPLRWPRALAKAAVDDTSGDTLDAALCALAAATAVRAGPPRYGLPPFDPVEGWIAGVPPAEVGR
jgi:hypothetical protein